MAKALFRSILLLVLLSLVACSGGGTGGSAGGGAEEPAALRLAADLDDLAAGYSGVDTSVVIEVPFDTPLAPPDDAAARAASEAPEPLTPAPPGWLRLYREDPLEAVPGAAYLGRDPSRLLFVPARALDPGTRYLAVLSSDIAGASGGTLGEDLSFPVVTAADAVAVRVSADRDVVFQGDPVHLSASCAAGADSVVWRFDAASASPETAEGAEVDHAYAETGTYRALAEVTDPYGRTFTGEAPVTVLPDPEEALAANPAVQGVEVLSPAELGQGPLAGLLGPGGDDVLSVAQAWVAPPGASPRQAAAASPGAPVLQVLARPERVPDLVEGYIEQTAGEGRFLGVVRFLGLPAVLAGGCTAEGVCTVDLLLDEGALRVTGTFGGREVGLDEPALSPTPAVYALSLVVGPDTVESLRTLLPDRIAEPLCRLSLDRDGALQLAVPRSAGERAAGRVAALGAGGFVTTAVGVVQGVVSAAGEAVDAGKEMAEALWDFLSRDELTLLGAFADLASTLTAMDPAARAAGLADTLADVYQAFQALAASFAEDPQGVISAHTNPKALVQDLRRFIDGNGGNDLASLFRRVVHGVNGAEDSLGTNPFEALTQPLVDAGGSVPDLLGGLSPDEDAHLVLTVGTSTSLDVQKGGTRRTFTLDQIDAWPVDDFLAELPDFPLSDIVTALSDLAGEAVAGLEAQMGFYYEAGSQRFTVRYRTLDGDDELYAFEAFASPSEGAQIQIRISDPLWPDTGITVTGSIPGLSGTALPPGPAGQLLQSLYSQATAFPELRAEIRSRFRNLLTTVQATTRPDISFGAGVSVGFELDYHVALGGKVAGSIGVSVSVGAGDVLDDMLALIKAAFASAREDLGLPASLEDGVPVVSFPDEAALMAFLKDLLDDVRSQAPDVFDHLQVALEASAEVGGGVGAGGTGTGGAGADVTLGLGVEIAASAADIYDIASFCLTHGSSLLFAGLTDQITRVRAAGGNLQQVFDPQTIPDLFREDLARLADEVSPDELDEFMHTLSTGLSVSLSLSVGGEGEAEEAVSGSVDLDTSAGISVNGEYLLNVILDSLRLAYQLRGLDDAAAYERLKTLDQPGVFPEIGFSALPIEAKISAGLDEGIKVEFEAAATATWLSGSVVLEGDPYRFTGGAVEGPATLAGFPAVVVTRDPAEPLAGEEALFTAHATALPGTGIASYAWEVDGEAAGTGPTLAWSFAAHGLHSVTVTVTQDDGATATRTVRVEVPNQPPPAPALDLATDAELSPDGSIPFTRVTDPEGDPVDYEVEILRVPGDVPVDAAYYTVDAEHGLIQLNGLSFGDYRVRIRALAAGEPGPWSEPVTVSLKPGAPSLVAPDNWTSVWIDDCVTLVWDTDQESAQVQIAAAPDFADPVYSEWIEGTDLEVCPSAMPEGGSLEPGWYYWRVRVAPFTGSPSPWSTVRALRVYENHSPTGAELVQAPARSYHTRDRITFAFQATDPDGDPLTYTLELSQPDLTLTSTTGAFEIAPGTLPPGQVIFGSIEVSDGRGGVAATAFAPWGFEVLNSPPDPPRPVSPGEGARISADKVTLQVRPPADFDGDPIEGYEFHVMREGTGTWEVHPSSSPSLTLTGLARGAYRWKVRALASSGTREGDFSDELVFEVLRNHPPEASTVEPPPGAFFPVGTAVTLTARASDPDGDPPAGYGFQVAADEAFREPVEQVERTERPERELQGLEPGAYFWRARAFDGYSGEPGPWSAPACFTVIDRVPAPGAAARQDTFEPGPDGRVALRFELKPGAADCLGRPAGEIVYQIGADPAFSRVLAEGPFADPIVLELKPGLYYFRALQTVAGMDSPWSGAVRFGVEGPPAASDDRYAVDEDTVLSEAAPGVLANDTDPDGDPLTADLVDGPAHGSLSLAPDGSFTYTPEPDFHGTDAFTYRAGDGTASSDPATVTITVRPVNDPPLARDDRGRTEEDTPVVIDVLANDADPDGDDLAVVAVSRPAHGTATTDGTTILYTPEADYSGRDVFEYRVSDPSGARAEASVEVVTEPVNDPPVIEMPGSATVAEGDEVDVEVRVTDPDGDAPQVGWDDLPGFCSAEETSQTTFLFHCAPQGWHAGTYVVTVTARDQAGAAASATLTLTVTPVSWPPVARDDAYVTDEDQELVVAAPGVLANDDDRDADPLAAEAVAGPSHGRVSLDADGSFRYTPDPDFHGTDAFTYRAGDGTAFSDPATVTITVRPVNDPPRAADDGAATGEDTPVVIDVLANDADPDGDPLAVTSAGPAAHGTVQVTGGAVRYTPDPDFNGTDTFPYAVTDGTAEATATVTVSVSPAPDPPVLAEIPDQGVAEGQVLQVTLSATDPDGDALAFGATGLPAFCSMEDRGDGTAALRCAPGQGDAGTYTVTVRVTDDGSPPGEDHDVFVLTVEDANWPPVARDDRYAVDEDGVLAVGAPGVLGNDEDPDGDPLEAELVRDGRLSHGHLVLYRNGGFRYTPDPDFHGTDAFTYRATDGELGSGGATVRITVRPVNDPPVLGEVADQTVAEGATLNAALSATDVDGDGLSFAAEAPGFCALADSGDGTAVLTCTPGPGDAGDYTVTVTVTDDGTPALSDEATFALTVTAGGADALVNGDFEAGMAPWIPYKPAIPGALVLEVVAADGSQRFHYRRTGSGSSGGEIEVYQVLDGLDLTPYSEVYLECDVKLVSHTLGDSGYWSDQNGGYGEWPGNIRFEFMDASENTYYWNNGFADFADAYGRTNYTRIPLGTWYHYRSPNLKNVTTTLTGPHNTPVPSGTPVQILQVRAGGSGWDFEGYFDNVRLILIK